MQDDCSRIEIALSHSAAGSIGTEPVASRPMDLYDDEPGAADDERNGLPATYDDGVPDADVRPEVPKHLVKKLSRCSTAVTA